MAEQEVNQNIDPEVDPTLEYKITSKDGQLLYQSNQTELDDCFYSIIALMSWTKTFNIGAKLKLTFTTISDDSKMELLSAMKKWASDSDASSTMFDQHLNKLNMAYYLSYIDMDNNGINLREKSIEDRIKFLGSMTEAALQLYGTYLFVFLELIRKSLLNQVSLKNS
jgi:hypothetical protein